MRLTRVLTVSLLVAGLALANSASPAAAAGPGCPPGSEVFGCAGGGGNQDDGGGGSTGYTGPPVDYVSYFDDDGTGVGAEPGYETGCWGIRAVPAGQGMTYDEAVADQTSQGENDVLWGNCEIEETIDPETVAMGYWYRAVAPPPPTPLHVAHNKAVTGLPIYLEIGGDIPAIATFNTPIGTLTFTMTPRYEVSWGDGAVTPTDSQGGPYPDGDVTHTYSTVGVRTITVDALWRATWTLAGDGGDFPELPDPTSDTLDLPVDEYQARIDPG